MFQNVAIFIKSYSAHKIENHLRIKRDYKINFTYMSFNVYELQISILVLTV